MCSFCPSRVLTSWDGFRSSARTAAPEITWYSRMASSCLMLAGLSKKASVAGGSAAKASLVGAKTVKGPVPERGDEVAGFERGDESREIRDASCELDD